MCTILEFDKERSFEKCFVENEKSDIKLYVHVTVFFFFFCINFLLLYLFVRFFIWHSEIDWLRGVNSAVFLKYI